MTMTVAAGEINMAARRQIREVMARLGETLEALELCEDLQAIGAFAGTQEQVADVSCLIRMLQRDALGLLGGHSK